MAGEVSECTRIHVCCLIAKICKDQVSYHEQRPNGVVDEDGCCCNEHAEAHETVKLDIVSIYYDYFV